MKVYLLALLALAFASDAAAQQIVRGRPPDTLFAPLRAADHVATIVRTPIGGPQVPFEVVVARSGDWQREESSSAEGVSVTFADFASGASYHWFRAADGPREAFSAIRESPENDYYAYTLNRHRSSRDTARRSLHRVGGSKLAPRAGMDPV